MKISLTQIDARRGFVLQRRFDEAQLDTLLDGYLGYRAAAPAQVDLRLALAGKGVSVTGTLVCTLLNQCRFCLDEVQQHLDLSLSLVLLPASTLATDEELELSADELDTIFFSNDEIDLYEILRESIVLEVESYLQCREGCAGLCIECGANLNRESCSCPPKPVDPRWQSLVELKQKRP